MSKNYEDDPNNNANHFDDKVFLLLLRKGIHEYLDDLIENLPEKNSGIKPHLSKVTKKKIKRMIRKAIRRERIRR